MSGQRSTQQPEDMQAPARSQTPPRPASPLRGAGLLRLPSAARVGWCALLGLLHSQAFAHADAWWLQLAALALLAWCTARSTPRAAAWCGLAFGTTWLGASTWWMYISLHDFGGLPAWMAALAVALLCAALSLYMAAAMALAASRRRGTAVWDAAAFAGCWLLAELARGALFTGFPWAASGYAHTGGPLAVLAPLIGVYGIGFVAAWLAALIGYLLAGRRSRAAWLALCGAAALLMLAGVAGPVEFSRPRSTLTLTLLQTNVPQDEKFAVARMPETLDWLSAQLLRSKSDLVVAPETAIPLLPDQLSPEYWQPIVEHFQDGSQSALIGLPLGNSEVGYTNSVAGISSQTRTAPGGAGFYRYDKHHLVPFGEFIPTGFRWFVDLMNIPLGDFNRGTLAAPSFDVRGERVAPNICYEDLFGEELATRFGDADRAPTMFVNVSNIAWFGNTVALHQHAEISRMRTLEFQRPMVRATNTGMTVVIDHTGAVRDQVPPYTREARDTSVQGRDGLTPFAWWSARAGLWPLLVLALLVVGWPRRSAL